MHLWSDCAQTSSYTVKLQHPAGGTGREKQFGLQGNVFMDMFRESQHINVAPADVYQHKVIGKTN